MQRHCKDTPGRWWVEQDQKADGTLCVDGADERGWVPEKTAHHETTGDVTMPTHDNVSHETLAGRAVDEARTDEDEGWVNKYMVEGRRAAQDAP